MADDQPPAWWQGPHTFRHPDSDEQPEWDETKAPVSYALLCPSCGEKVTVIVAYAEPETTATPQTWRCPHCRHEAIGAFAGQLLFVNKGQRTPRL